MVTSPAMALRSLSAALTVVAAADAVSIATMTARTSSVVVDPLPVFTCVRPNLLHGDDGI